MGVLEEYHQALGDLIFRFEGTLERFTGDGLMVFFNDPVRCDDGPLRAIRMAVAMRTRVRGLAESWARQGHDLAMGIGIAQGYATLGRIGFEGRHDYAAIGSVTNLAARLCADAEPWQILVTERVFSAAGPSGRRRGRRRPRAERVSAAPSTPSASRASTARGPSHDRRPVDRAGRGADVLSALDRGRAIPSVSTGCRHACPASGTRCGSTTTTSRSSSSRRSPSTARWPSSGSLSQAYRGAVPVPARAAAPAAAADGLRDVDADRPGDRRVLPGPPQRRHPEPCPGPALPHLRHDASPRSLSEKLLERPRLLARIADLIPNPARSHLVPYNTTELERDVALSLGIPMYGADPRLAQLGPRPAAVASSPRWACRTRWAPRTCTASTSSPTPSSGMRRRAARRWPASSSSSTRASRVRERRRPPDRAPRARARPGERAEVMTRLRDMELESPRPPPSTSTSPSSPRAPESSRSASPGRSCAARVSSSGSCPAASRAALDPRPAARRAQRAEVPGMRLPRGSGVRAAHHRARRGDRAAARARGRTGRFAVDFVVVRDAGGRGRRTPSSSTCARAAPPIRSSPCSS